jgi:hypothetical protein
MTTRKRGPEFLPPVAPRPKKQVDSRGRALSQMDAHMVVAWLNATKGSEAHARVLKILREFRELGEMLASLYKQRKRAKEARVGRKEIRTMQEMMHDAAQRAGLEETFRERHNALNAVINQCLFGLNLSYDIDKGVWYLGSKPKPLSPETVPVSAGGITIDVCEETAVGALARLATCRRLFKVRLCENCKERWRVSERELDRFCSSDCREIAYKHDPARKRSKAESQRKYRQQFNRPTRNDSQHSIPEKKI